MPGLALRNIPLVLIIRDGWGENPHREHDAFNAVKLARTPVAAMLDRDWPRTLIRTSGEDVGLPAATMGNSEVGHQNIGAGRIVDQELMRITRAIRAGEFFRNPALNDAFEHALKTGGSVHLLGLVSDGKVHSDIEHLLALIDIASRLNFPGDRLFIHAITDGRDTGPNTGLEFIQRVESALASSHAGRIATVMGRYDAMDRDHRWERTAGAYECLTGLGHPMSHQPQASAGVGARASAAAIANVPWTRVAASASEAVQRYYDHPVDDSRRGDEFIPSTRIAETYSGMKEAPRPIGLIRSGDSVIFFNFRGDRPRQLTKAFVLDDRAWKAVKGGGFDRGPRIDNLYFCTMTGYEEGLPVSAIAFTKPPMMKHILGEVMANAGLHQFRCAETEKFAHVTFFFNDYREPPFPGEIRELIPSPRDVSTYDQKPEMSAYGVRDAVLSQLTSRDCPPLIIVNFANGDMVGHTGKLDAAVRAIEVVDSCVGAILEATLSRGGSLIITADHGNAEQMWDPITNSPHTAHTTYDVPLYVVGEAFRGRSLRLGGRLADLAPTALAMIGMPQPAEMTGTSLLA
jgi:2,3-bisphosphoglycerate-independent phosphoglycerate mutase